MAGRRTSLASLAGQKVDDVPGASDPLLLTLSLDKLVPTRFNPRRNFGTESDLREFGERLKERQLQPAVVVSRSAYLKLWPEEEEHVGSASYVIANGERRWRGSQAAGAATLDVVHREDVASSRAVFLASVLAENNDREDLDPIERALGIETMVIELGGADKVAAHYEKTKGWVSQQRKLLKLVPELQALVSSGDIPVRAAREIAGLPQEEQLAAWEAEQERREAAKKTPRPRGSKGAKASGASGAVPRQGERFTAVNRSEEPISTDRSSPGVEVPTRQDASTPEPLSPGFRQHLMTATRSDVGVLADMLGQHLSPEMLAALVEDLNVWLNGAPASEPQRP